MSAGYLRSLLKKTSGTTKVNRQAHQLKKDDGTLTSDDTEKATMLNDYFYTVAEIEEKVCKLKVNKATGSNGVSARLLKYAGMSIAPSLTSVFKQSFEACKPPDQWKIATVSSALKKKDERKTEHVTDHCLCSVYQVN